MFRESKIVNMIHKYLKKQQIALLVERKSHLEL